MISHISSHCRARYGALKVKGLTLKAINIGRSSLQAEKFYEVYGSSGSILARISACCGIRAKAEYLKALREEGGL